MPPHQSPWEVAGWKPLGDDWFEDLEGERHNTAKYCLCHGCDGCAYREDRDICWQPRASKHNKGPDGLYFKWGLCHDCGSCRRKRPLVRLGPPTLPLGPPVPEQAIVGPLGPPTLPPPGPQTLPSRPPGLPGPEKFLKDIEARNVALEKELQALRARAAEMDGIASVEPPPPAAPPTQQATSSDDLMGSRFYADAERIADMRTETRNLRRMMEEMLREIKKLGEEMKDTIEQILANQAPNVNSINQFLAAGGEAVVSSHAEAVSGGDGSTPSSQTS